MRYTILILFCLLSLGAMAQDTPKGYWLEQSFRYLEENKLDSAEIALKNELKQSPDNPMNPFLLNNLAAIQHRQGKQEEALLSYSAALGTYPKNETFLQGRASLLLELNQEALALEDYNTLLSVNPDDAESLYQRGLLSLHIKDFAQAEADFRRLLDLQPDGLYPRKGLATLAKVKGDYAEAEKIYNYLIEKEPEMPDLYISRSELYLLMEKPSQALRDVNKALSLDDALSSDPYPYIIRYRAKMMLHETKDAERDLKKAEELQAR